MIIFIIIRPNERSAWDLKNIADQLQNVTPLNCLPVSLLNELARIIFFECLDTGVTG